MNHLEEIWHVVCMSQLTGMNAVGRQRLLATLVLAWAMHEL